SAASSFATRTATSPPSPPATCISARSPRLEPLRMVMRMPYVAPLCPAGHLPHEEGDQPAARLSPIAMVAEGAVNALKADLPPRGGDVRQDRGGREGTRCFEIVPSARSQRKRSSHGFQVRS